MIREYKQWVLPDADDASQSPLGRMAREVKESAKALAGGNLPAVTWNDIALPVNASATIAAKPVSRVANGGTKKVDSFKVGEVLAGKVTRVDENCAYVSVRDHYGIVPKGQVSREWVDDVRDFLSKGDRVNVKVIKIERDKDMLVLSINQCE